MKYEDRIVAFIDILGFANIIKGTIHSDAALSDLVSTLNYVQGYFQRVRQNYKDPKILQLTQFSDTLVMSVSMKDSAEMISIFRHLKNLQINLIHKNLLLRGGIVKGLLVHNEDLVVGPGIINAYKLESKCALHPRIIIDPKVMWQYVRSNGVNQKVRLKSFLPQGVFNMETDGTYYVDYFNEVEDFLENGISKEDHFNKLCSLAAGSLDNDDISVRVKYLWMREKIKASQYYDEFESTFKKVVVRRRKPKRR